PVILRVASLRLCTGVGIDAGFAHECILVPRSRNVAAVDNLVDGVSRFLDPLLGATRGLEDRFNQCIHRPTIYPVVLSGCLLHRSPPSSRKGARCIPVRSPSQDIALPAIVGCLGPSKRCCARIVRLVVYPLSLLYDRIDEGKILCGIFGALSPAGVPALDHYLTRIGSEIGRG